MSGLVAYSSILPRIRLIAYLQESVPYFRIKHPNSLILVKGNPTKNISDSLSILNVWKEGVAIDVNGNANKIKK